MLNAKDNEFLTQVGPGTPMGDMLRRFWTPFLEASKLPGPDCDPVEVRLLGEDLVAYCDTQGRYGLLVDRCPHRGTPLYYGRNEENGIRCIYHGWKFDVEGRCVDMPSEPEASNFKQKVKVGAYPVRELAGVLWTYMGPPQLIPEMPDFEWTRLPASHQNIVRYNQNCNWVQALEGDIDTSHGPFLHRGSFDYDLSLTEMDVKLISYDASPRWIIQNTDFGMMMAAQRDSENPGMEYWRIHHWFLPYFTVIPPDVGRRRIHGHIWIPVDDEHTDVWCIYWAPVDAFTDEERAAVLGGPEPHIGTLDPITGKLRATRDNHFLQDRHVQRTRNFTGIRGVREQDTAVIEGMGAIADREREHLGTSDTAIIAMRRTLMNVAKALRDKGEEPYAASHIESSRLFSWSALIPKGADFQKDPAVQELHLKATV